jgi:glycosyltransferase involved in cell wall biosynthesis
MANKVLSIIVPIHNEEKTLKQIIQKIEEVQLDNITKELILINDFSSDSSSEILTSYHNKYIVLTNATNLGKSGTIKKGILASSGDYVIIQDADLEYDPQDYKKLISALEEPGREVVYGSRFKNSSNQTYNKYWLANRLLTILSNICTRQNLSDMETCYKLFKGNLIREIAPTLSSPRFGFEAEITAILARRKKQITEIPISYIPRTTEEGKHIGLKDGIQAIHDIIKYNLLEH